MTPEKTRLKKFQFDVLHIFQEYFTHDFQVLRRIIFFRENENVKFLMSPCDCR
jgi:hypothetical protein